MKSGTLVKVGCFCLSKAISKEGIVHKDWICYCKSGDSLIVNCGMGLGIKRIP